MFVSNFPRVIKHLLKNLPKNDYPVLNTFLFVSCWIGFAMDKSLVSMRDLLGRVNSREKKLDISTFSKASKKRESKVFEEILNQGIEKLKNQIKKSEEKIYFPLDSTIIILTSKLLWTEGYHQVKLFAGLNSLTSEVGGIKIHFGQGNDSKEGEKTLEQVPQNGIGVMDRGFCSKERIRQLSSRENKFFVMRIKNNMKLEMLENGRFIVGGEKDSVETRIVNFCSLEGKKEYRLATNLSESEFSHEEIGEIYRKRWAIETLWKFLKMHLKLDKLITKNENGIRIQIYSCLIGYIILQLTEISQEIGDKILDKLRYLQSFMNENISYIHWFRRMSFSW
jgi:putative transposase